MNCTALIEGIPRFVFYAVCDGLNKKKTIPTGYNSPLKRVSDFVFALLDGLASSVHDMRVHRGEQRIDHFSGIENPEMVFEVRERDERVVHELRVFSPVVGCMRAFAVSVVLVGHMSEEDDATFLRLVVPPIEVNAEFDVPPSVCDVTPLPPKVASRYRDVLGCSMSARGRTTTYTSSSSGIRIANFN